MLLFHMVMFLESGQPICGNGLVEQGEECDCGYSDQCKDECCFNANEPEDKKCKLKPGKRCRYVFLWISQSSQLKEQLYED